MNSQSVRNIVGTLLLSSAVAACATMSQPPSDLLSRAESEIRVADDVGARDAAPLAYRSANENLSAAKKAMEKEEYDDARVYLEKALADAEYAATKARSEQAQKASEQVDQNLEALKKAL
ncbi:MAG TPA: DUF4398 domain-containing protein [Marinagarivorans sp.]